MKNPVSSNFLSSLFPLGLRGAASDDLDYVGGARRYAHPIYGGSEFIIEGSAHIEEWRARMLGQIGTRDILRLTSVDFASHT